MVLYVDETESTEYFIVTGFLVKSKQDIELAYKKFRKSINNNRMPAPLKTKLFTECKSVSLDRTFQHIQIKMLQELKNFPNCVIYSCYLKNSKVFSKR